MPDDKRKKKKNKNGVPDRWLDYCAVGQRIPGTRFIAFKVPLKASLNHKVPASDSFSVWDLLDYMQTQNQELGLIIDLTFTNRYYRLADVPQSCSYMKIPTRGQQVPSDATILSFKRAVRRFLEENQDNDRLIGVHCTHGLNRTGYLVCRYLIDVDGVEASAALKLFNSCRGHGVERQNYVNDLQRGARRSNAGIDRAEGEAARGLAVERPPWSAFTEEETLQAGGGATKETGPGDETQPPANRRRRKARHHCQKDQRTLMAPPAPQRPLLSTPPPQRPLLSTPPQHRPLLSTPPPHRPLLSTPPPHRPLLSTPPPQRPLLPTPPPHRPLLLTPAPQKPLLPPQKPLLPARPPRHQPPALLKPYSWKHSEDK